MTREKNVPRPSAIQPCFDMATLLLDVQTAAAHATVTTRIVSRAPSRTNWPPVSEARFAGSGEGGSCKIAPLSKQPPERDIRTKASLATGFTAPIKGCLHAAGAVHGGPKMVYRQFRSRRLTVPRAREFGGDVHVRFAAFRHQDP